MTEKEKRLHRVCFTGHRQEKLTRSEAEIKLYLEAAIRHAITDGLNVFLTGACRGVDLWAGQIVIQLRDNGWPIKLICACPYDGFEKGWRQEWQEQYRNVLAAADFVKYVCQEYSNSCFQVRNQYMVDHSSRVIAVYNGQKSGTRNTIEYAVKVGVPVVYIRG